MWTLDLTTRWILESAHKLDSSGEWIATHSSELEGTQKLRRERHAHMWHSEVRGAMLALPTRSSEERIIHLSEWEGTQMLRRERHAHRWPSLVRGAMLAQLTRRAPITELWGVENSILRMRGNSDAQKRAACSEVTLYSEGRNASSTTVPWWPLRLSQRPTTWPYDPGVAFRSLEQGSHPSLDLASTSEVITAIADSL